MDESRDNQKRSGKKILISLLILGGLAVLLYSPISTRWNDYRNRELETSYHKSVQEKGKSNLSEMKEEAQSYNQTLVVPSVPDAFSIRDGIRDPEYEALLNPGGDGIMASLDIPAIHVTLSVYHYTTDDVLEKGAGHLFGSSLPVGGKGTHAVISAHRGLPGARMFTDLNLLKKGDCFYLHVLGETLAYEVDQILTVDPDQTEFLAIDQDQDYVTLVTCTPYAVNTQRLLVRGHRVPYQENAENEINQPGRRDQVRMFWEIVSAATGALLAVLIVKLTAFARKRRANRKK